MGGKSMGTRRKLDIILGRAGSGKTYECLRMMAEHMAQAPLGPALVMIVPEHMTYKAERDLAAMTNGRGTMRGYVFGFRRLSWRLLSDLGQTAQPRLTAVGKRLLLKKIIEERGEDLTVLKRAAQQRGFTSALAKAIEELKSYGGTPEQLDEAAKAVGEGYLNQKLTDIATLYREFQKATAGRYEDAEDRMTFLTAAIPQAELFTGAEVWLDGFVFFNPQERNVLQALICKAEKVHVTLPMDTELMKRENSLLFYRAQKTLSALEEIARAAGIEATVRQLGEPRRFLAAEGIAAIERRLFSFPVRRSESSAGVHVVEAATRRLEIEAAAADIIRLCRDEGLRYRDIGILLRDAENYRQILEFTLADYGIPFFCDAKRAGVHHPLAELIRSVLATAVDGWRYDDVFRAAKTDLFPICRDDMDILENYVLEFGIRGKASWEKEWPYRRRSAKVSEKTAAERLARVNEARKKLGAPLLGLDAALKAAANARELTTAVFAFLAELDVAGILRTWEKNAEEEGRLEEAKEHRMIWDAVMELFDQMVTISGEEKMTLEEYAAVLDDGLDALEIALIPPSLDAVTVASFDQNSLNNIAALYVLGANDGVMPRRIPDKGLISDADRAQIRRAGEGIKLELSPGEDESYGENYLLYHGLTEARSYLWLSYALADSEGNGLSRSPLLTRLLEILPVEEDSIALDSMEERPDFRFTVGERSASRLAPALRKYKGKKAPAWGPVYNWAREKARPQLENILRGRFSTGEEEALSPALARRLYTRQGRLSGSVTRFENFYACPFRHFAQYGLRLAERPICQFTAPDFGTLLHDVMRRFGERLQAEKRRWSEVSDEERHQLTAKIMAEEAPQVQNEILLSTAQYQNLQERIARTAESSLARLSAYDAQSAFHPRYFELRFGEESPLGSLVHYELDESCMLDVVGQIDRIDLSRLEEGGPLYFLVIDYKSGRTDLSLDEVYYGLRLQLLTYVLATSRILQKEMIQQKPAGMLYCLLQNPRQEGKTSAFRREEACGALWKKLQMTGWLLDDTAVLQGIDNSHRFVKIAFNKDGSLSANSRKNVRTLEEMRALLRYTSYQLRTAGQGVLSGQIAARPYRKAARHACEYCAYRAVCGFDLKLPGFMYRDLPDLDDFSRAMAERMEDKKL